MPPPQETLMRRAVALALRGRGAVAPNPMVGAVVARGERVVGEGWHEQVGGPHAEVHALQQAGESARGADLYVTLEPCCKHGRTPPCTDAVAAAGVRRVFVGASDPMQGDGAALLRKAGVEVVEGVLREECERLIRPFLKLHLAKRPYVIAKWAMTADGRIATHAKDSRWISGEASRRAVHQLRGLCEAVVVGIGTALADDPLLTARAPGARSPRRVVLDRDAALPLDSQLVRTLAEAPVWVICKAAPPDHVRALREAGCEVFDISERPETTDFDAAMAVLGERGLTYALVEGGSGILTAAFDARAVDEVRVFVAPKLVGGAGALSPIAGVGTAKMSQAIRLARPQWTVLEGDAMLEADVEYPSGNSERPSKAEP